MEHICLNCNFWIKDYPIWNEGKMGSCTIRKSVGQALGNIPEDFFATNGKDFYGADIKQGSLIGRELGVHTAFEFGKDCEYFLLK